jgi:hypothetical protein
LDGTYFSNGQDCMYFTGSSGVIESKDHGILGHLSLKQTKNKLRFYSTRRMSPLFFFRKRTDKYYFRLLERREDSFMVAPISQRAREFFNNQQYLIFTTKYHFSDQTNYFTKIIYRSSRCFGLCHDLHLQLDYSGNLKVTDNGDGITDTAKNDNYFGRVSYEDLDSLRTILKYSRLKTLVWPANRHCTDFPDLTLILYQQDKRYYFHINAACLPIVSAELNGFLQSLFNYRTLHKVDTTWTYER